jgi:hypothetical protein
MRGQQSIFSDILPPILKEKNQGIGRNKDLIARRNTKIINRYYFYAQLQPQRLDYSYIINLIAAEFDLSDFRVIIIMQENHAELKEVFAVKPQKKELEKKYPYLCWQ